MNRLDETKLVIRVDVWYEDGLHPEPWEDLPADGVQLILLHYADGTRRVMMGSDYYFRSPGPADWIYGSTDHREQLDRYDGAVVLTGRWTDDATYSHLIHQALEG